MRSAGGEAGRASVILVELAGAAWSDESVGMVFSVVPPRLVGEDSVMAVGDWIREAEPPNGAEMALPTRDSETADAAGVLPRVMRDAPMLDRICALALAMAKCAFCAASCAVSGDNAVKDV